MTHGFQRSKLENIERGLGLDRSPFKVQGRRLVRCLPPVVTTDYEYGSTIIWNIIIYSCSICGERMACASRITCVELLISLQSPPVPPRSTFNPQLSNQRNHVLVEYQVDKTQRRESSDADDEEVSDLPVDAALGLPLGW